MKPTFSEYSVVWYMTKSARLALRTAIRLHREALACPTLQPLTPQLVAHEIGRAKAMADSLEVMGAVQSGRHYRILTNKVEKGILANG